MFFFSFSFSSRIFFDKLGGGQESSTDRPRAIDEAELRTVVICITTVRVQREEVAMSYMLSKWMVRVDVLGHVQYIPETE